MHSDNILITGASSGLGEQLALLFASKGHNLFITGTNKKRLIKLKNKIKKYKVKCSFIVADLSCKKQIKKLSNFAIKNHVNILINNAAILCNGLELQKASLNYIDSMIKVNLVAPIILTKLLLNKVKQIININSIAGLENKKNRTIYCTTKSGLKVFSNTLKLETNINIQNIFISKIKKHFDDFGLTYEDICYKIYCNYYCFNNDLIIDGRKEV